MPGFGRAPALYWDKLLLLLRGQRIRYSARPELSYPVSPRRGAQFSEFCGHPINKVNGLPPYGQAGNMHLTKFYLCTQLRRRLLSFS